MNTINFSLYILTYNFIIGFLLMLSSEKLGAFAGRFTGAYKTRISHAAELGIFTFGASVAVLTFGIYIAAYILKL
jgi:hypothetical protein